MSVKYGHIPTDSRLFKKINSMDALQAILGLFQNDLITTENILIDNTICGQQVINFYIRHRC
jgi:hypothetical protein